MTSACLGEARNTSDPKRARSFRPLVAFIISIAQHAKPKVAGHSDDLRAQLMSESSRVVRISGNASPKTFSRPITLSQVSSFKFQVKLPLTNLKLETWNLKLCCPANALQLQLRFALSGSNQMPLS